MIQAIVKRLKTGSIKNVVEHGSELPTVPYVVVKPEAGAGRRMIRIIPHYPQGYQSDLADYAFNKCSVLLKNWVGTDSSGNSFKVRDADEYTDVITENDDNSISMERVFFVPSRLH